MYFRQWLSAPCWEEECGSIYPFREWIDRVENMIQLRQLHQELIETGIDPI